jgi:hypothetical protein
MSPTSCQTAPPRTGEPPIVPETSAIASQSIVLWGLSLSRWRGSITMQGMVIQMNDEQFLTLAQLQAFLDGTLAVDFSVLPRRALQHHRPHGPPLRLSAPEARAEGRCAAIPRAGKRLLAPATHTAGKARRRPHYTAQALPRLAYQLQYPLHRRRRTVAGSHRFAARNALRACHQEAYEARLEPVRRCAL